MVIATVLKADNMTFHRFFNTKCLTTNNAKQIHILPIRRVQAKIFWAGKKINNQNPRKLKWISDIFYKVGQEPIVK